MKSLIQKSSVVQILTTRIIISSIFTFIVAANVVSAEAENLPTGEELMDKYIEVTGGIAAYDSIQNRVTNGKFELPAQGISFDLTVYNARPNKSYIIMESEAYGKMERGTNGEVAWELSAMTGPQIKKGQEKLDMIRESIFDKYENWREIYKKVECVGIDTVESKICYKVIVTPTDGKPQTFYYDKQSYLLTKVDLTLENPMGTFPVETYLSDYREIDGILIAFKSRVKVLGQERIVTATEVEHNIELPSTQFDLPAEVRALMDKPKGENVAPDSIKQEKLIPEKKDN